MLSARRAYYVERRRGVSPGLVERSARHCKSIDCLSIRRSGLSYVIWPSPSPGHGSHHVRPFGYPSGLLLLLRHALHKYGEFHARTHARTHALRQLLCLIVVRRGLVTLCICTVRVQIHASKRAAFPRRISVHFRVSCLNVFLASPSNGLLSDPISPYLPACPLN